MKKIPKAGKLDNVSVDNIFPNEENPRLHFRSDELEELQESIAQYGVQVPIAVYEDKNKYILIDGERRWRCSRALNIEKIPAIIRPKPSELENLLLMFNIHALREQWDLLTIALKLPKVIELIAKEKGDRPTEAELSTATGLTRGIIRRCRLLIELPKKYQDMLLREQAKPKSRQKLSEDLFIEIEKALKSAQRAMPNVIKNKDKARQKLLGKYKSGVIKNIVDIRLVGKIARAENVGADYEEASHALQKLLSDDTYTIESAYRATVASSYTEKDIIIRIEGLLDRLEDAPDDAIDEDVIEKLAELIDRAAKILGARQ